MITFTKDPQATLDYQVDWTSWLAGDTIATVTWAVPASITQTLVTQTTTTATIWLAGGTIGTSATIVCHVTTAGGRTDDRSFLVRIWSK